MGILSWILVGIVAGAIGKWLHPGEDPGGIFVTIIIGIVGGLIGGYIGYLLNWGSVDGFNFRSLVLATLGSILVLFLYRKIKR